MITETLWESRTDGYTTSAQVSHRPDGTEEANTDETTTIIRIFSRLPVTAKFGLRVARQRLTRQPLSTNRIMLTSMKVF